jgi:cytochrome c556
MHARIQVRRLLIATVVAGAALSTVPAFAQFQKPEDAIKYRQSVMTVMANHFGRIGAMVQGKVPFDAKAAADNAAIVVTMSRLPFVAFGEGTDMGLPTRAKPAIWSQNAKFKDLASKLRAEAEKLEAATKSGDAGAVKTAFGGVGKECKSCHDDFRAEKYSSN